MYRLEKQTLREILQKSTVEYGNRPSLGLVGGTPYTYRRVGTLAAGLQAFLASRAGIGKGRRVALLGENSPEWGIVYFAAAAMGAVVVPILTDFTTDQILNILAHAECDVVFVSRKLKEKLSRRVDIPVFDMEEVPRLADQGGSPGELVPAEVDEGDLAAIIYTSGTTGNSKGVMLSHRNIVSNTYATRTIIRMHPGDRLLSILPLAHTYECTLGFVGGFMQGAAIYFLDKPPTASALLPAMAKIRPTIMLSVPLIMEKVYRSSILPKLQEKKIYAKPFFRRLLNRIAGKKLYRTFGGRLRFFGIGGAALAPDVERFLIEARFPYAIGYGLTETSPLVAGANPSRTSYRSTGPALEGVQVRIVPDEGGSEDGEIQVKGPNVMMGYYKDPEKTAEVFTEDGWFRTGDLGRVDGKGRYYIRGRSKTMILGPSGENIYPEEIEALINQSDFVQESLVYGEQTGGLTALVLFKPEALERLNQDMRQIFGAMEDQATDMANLAEERTREFARRMEERSREILENLRRDVNTKLAAFSRIGRVVRHDAPFEKTPTQKIKRHFYPRSGDRP